MFKIVWLESLTTPLSTHTSLLLGRLSIGCLLNTVPYSRLPHWCTSFYIMVIQNILYLSLNLDLVFITHIKAKRMVWKVPHFATSPYISLLHILASALLMMLQIFGMICLMMYIWPLLSTHSERCPKPISLHMHIHSNFCFSWYLSLVLNPATSRVNHYRFLLFLFS